MEKKESTWLEFKLQSLRYGMYTRRLPLLLLLNVILVIIIGSLVLYLVEEGTNPAIHDMWDAAWCMFVSMATIGYGDVVPVTFPGQITVLVCMVIGIGALSTYITTLATRRVSKTKRRYSGLQGNTNATSHIIVCGWNSRGPHVVDRLKLELGGERRRVVLLADLEESPLDDDSVFFFRGSPASESDLRRVNIEQAGSVVLLADDTRGSCQDDIDSRTVLAALTIRALNQTVNMTAEILQPENINHLKLARVGEVLDSDVVLGNLIARSALHYGLIGIVTELVSRKEDMRIFSMPVSEDMVGRGSEEIVPLLHERHTGKLIGFMTGSGFKSYDQPHVVQEGEQLLLIAETAPDGTDVSSG